jgi:predicted HTH transcriptional regulator
MNRLFASKYEVNSGWNRIIKKISSSTALRDLQELVAHGILRAADSGGRSTNYLLVED